MLKGLEIFTMTKRNKEGAGQSSMLRILTEWRKMGRTFAN